MQRSEINTIRGSADQFIRSRGSYLPPFAYSKPAAWRSKGPEVHEIVANHLGWDITDFGKGDFTNYACSFLLCAMAAQAIGKLCSANFMPKRS